MLALLLVCALALTVRLLDVQVRQHATLAADAAAQQQSVVTIPATRGRILDRTGRVLASDVRVWEVFADPGLIPADRRADVAGSLAPILNMGPGHIRDLINVQSQFVVLAHGVSDAIKAKVTGLGYSGLGTTEENKRVYNESPVPGTSFASNLLGFVDASGNGQYGVEGYYNSTLGGRDGQSATIQDSAGNTIALSHEKTVPPQNGSDLQLGLDPQVQYWAEQALAQGVTSSKAQSGTAMVMDVKTGAIRAWADYPSYDANNYATASYADLKDATVSDLYEPGSVMKTVTFAGGLDQHVITPNYAFDEGPVNIDGFTIKDWDFQAHGRITMQYVLEQSLNDGAIKVMQLMGMDSFYRNLLAFGIGAPTGIDLAGEVNQPIPPEPQMTPVDAAVASFGQGVETTPVEMLAATNAVANGGVWVQPHAVEDTINPATGVRTPFVPVTRRIMDPTDAATLAHMLTGVVDVLSPHPVGSGFEVSLAKPYPPHEDLTPLPQWLNRIAGKTGTASEVDAATGQYGSLVDVSFIGFLPVPNPQFTLMVLLQKPTVCTISCEGAYVAAPIWKQIAVQTIDAWRIEPN